MLKTKVLAAHDMLALLAAPRDKVAGRWVRRPAAAPGSASSQCRRRGHHKLAESVIAAV